MNEKSPKGESEQKIYVLDTNVLIHDPDSPIRFEENEVVVPIVVVEELDDLKKDRPDRLASVSQNARHALKFLDSFRVNGEFINNNVAMANGGTLRVEVNNDTLNDPDSIIKNLSIVKNDNRILRVAFNLNEKEKKSNPEKPRRVVIVTKDTALRIKAIAVGLLAEDYMSDFVDFDTLYTGHCMEPAILPDEIMETLFSKKSVPYELAGLMPNQFFEARATSNDNKTTARYFEGSIHAVNHFGAGRAYDLSARNPGQHCALDLLMNDKIRLVTLVGKAGTGKTLLAIAAGLQKVMCDGVYDRLIVTRPIIPVGKDIGFLPGTVEEKMDPWMRPIYDSLDYLMMSRKKRKGDSIETDAKGMAPYKVMMANDQLEIQPLTFVRGLTIPYQFFIIDEAQNLTPHQIRTLTTRAGEGTKIVLTGDPNQIDDPYLTRDTNGLTYLIDRLKGRPTVGHYLLTEGERSELATMCADLL